MKTKTTISKITALLLSLVLVVGMTPLTAFAADDLPLGDSTAPSAAPLGTFAHKPVGEILGYVGGVEYTSLGGGNAKVSDYDTATLPPDLTIPSTITFDSETYTVTEIGDDAFNGFNRLTSVVIPDSVTKIGELAFAGCEKITSITIGDSVQTIANDAFAGCTQLTSVVIPDSVSSVGEYAFANCYSLTNITIGDSVQTIGKYAFAQCISLTTFDVAVGNTYYSTVNGILYNYDKSLLISYPPRQPDTHFSIPNSVQTIGNAAFANCSSLTNITIGDSVQTIGDYVFTNCTNLADFAVATGNTHYSAVDGILYNYAKSSLISYPAGNQDTSFSIPNSVTEIGEGAFQDCTNLGSITIPHSVTEIGKWAFQDCTSLGSITIPDSVTEIGDSTFANCTSLGSITIPDSVTEIGDYAFTNCTSLGSIAIPDSVTEIGELAFWNCASLTTVSFHGTTPPPTLGTNIFFYTPSLTTINVPVGSEAAYKSAFPSHAALIVGTHPALSDTSLSMQIGNTVTLDISMGAGVDKASTVSISSGSTAIATVDKNALTADGTVTVKGISAGNTAISLTWVGGSFGGTTTAVAVTVTATPLGTAPTITTTVLPNGQVGVAYSQTLTATGTAPIVWSLVSGTWHSGFTLSSAGVISGTPTRTGTATFTVKASNGVAPDTTQALTIVVDPAGTLPVAPTITINTQPIAETTVTAGSISGSVSVSATASDGSTPTYQWFNSPANTAVAGATSASFPIPTGLAAGSYSYYCIASSGGASATSNAAKVVVVPPVVATTTPAVTSANPINLDLNGSATGFVTVTLGASGASGNVLAGQADITVSGSAVTATPAVLTADGNVTITAQSVGTATISVAFSGKDITDTSYDETITVNVTDSNKPVTPVNPPTTSGGSSSGSGGGSSKADGARPTTTTTNRPLTKAEATKLFETALAAKPASATTLSIKVQNKTSVTKEVLAELAALAKKNGVTLTVHFDNVVGGKVVSRLSVNPATATADLDLNITENKALAAKFAKFYSNPLAAFTVKAGGSVAIKLPANLKPEGLVIYSYDAATNTYAVIPNAKPWVDKNGYLHFELPTGTEVVISQGELVKK